MNTELLGAEYTFAGQGGFRVPAQVAGERLAQLSAGREVVSPKEVVDDARPEDADLHPVFEWDDAEAGEKYRITQAQQLIRSIRVVAPAEEGKPPEHKRVYVNVTVGIERGYAPLVRVMSDGELRDQVLVACRAEMKAWRTRYAELHEFAALFTEVDRVLNAPVTPAMFPMAAK